MNANWLRIRPRARKDDPPETLLPDSNGVPALRTRAGSPPTSLPRRRAALLRPLPLVGFALALLALLGYLSVYSHANHRSPVLVAARDLAAGTLLRPGDLTSAKIAADRPLLAALVPRSQQAAVVGRRLATAVPAGAPLPRAALAAQTQAPASLTLSLPALHALGGALLPGDRVTVLATFDNGAGRAQTRAVARGLEVLAVGRPPSGLEQSAATVPVTVALPNPSLASALALANSEAKLDLLREGGSGQDAPIPTVSEAP
jgi:Flp pilus assembly protein CpaB